jgi:Mg/Co/Ni transporter MgtE
MSASWRGERSPLVASMIVSATCARARVAGWDLAVVVNNERVVFGLLREKTMADDPNPAAEQLMKSGPATIRPGWTSEKATEYLRRNKLARILVTTSDGRLVGLFDQKEAQRQMVRLHTAHQK